MKIKVQNWAVVVIFVCMSSFAKNTKTMKQWEKCRDRAESSVNQMEVGIWGVEAEIKSKCGEPPAQEPSALTGAIGMSPYDLVRSKAWKKKFLALTKSNYSAFVDRLVMSSGIEFDGAWIVGKGFAQHCGGSDEAAFAINSNSGEIFAVMLENGNSITKFGFSSMQSAPPFLQTWLEGIQ
ncbi:MAG: hypothetical protein RL318_894 [Fibrobacterota bacterium]